MRFRLALLLLALLPPLAHAQTLEQRCPPNSAVLQGHQTIDESNGLSRQQVCVNESGDVVLNGVISNVSFSNGVFKLDGSKYPCTMAGLQAIIRAAEATGGSTVDTRLCRSMTLTAETDVGDGTHAIVLILPSSGVWLATGISDGSSCFLKVFDGSEIYALGASNGADKFTIKSSGPVNAGSMICTQAAAYTRIDAGVLLYNPNSLGAYTYGLLYSDRALDDSVMRGLSVANYSGIGIKVSEPCCGASYENLVSNGNGGAGARPLVIQTGAGALGPVAFMNVSADHAGTGQSEISVTQPTGSLFETNFYNVYAEGNSAVAATAPHVDISVSNGCVDVFGLQVYSRNPNETVYGVQIENNSGTVNLNGYGYYGSQDSPPVLNDLFNSIAINGTQVSNTITHYSTESPFSIEQIGSIRLSSGAASVRFKTPFRVSPVVCTSSDTTAPAAVKVSATTRSLTLVGTSDDIIAYDCKGN